MCGPLAWNGLPNEIRFCDEIEASKRNLYALSTSMIVFAAVIIVIKVIKVYHGTSIPLYFSRSNSLYVGLLRVTACQYKGNRANIVTVSYGV